MIKFKLRYFIFAILLFLIEVLIARYIHDAIIRPYIGDFLVVVFIYCFIKAFFNFRVLPTAIGVLIFSYTIEILPYFKFVEMLGLGHNKLARIILGTSFEWVDLVMYTLGI